MMLKNIQIENIVLPVEISHTLGLVFDRQYMKTIVFRIIISETYKFL